MANDGKIYIIITDKTPGGDGQPGGSTIINKEDKSKNNALSDYAAHQFFNLITNQTKNIINYQLNNIGNFTGEYDTQRHVNFARQTISSLIGLGMAAISGAKYGGGWGALIGVTVATTGMLINSGLQYNSDLLQNKKTNYEIAQLRDRSGLNTLKDGSRGTEN